MIKVFATSVEGYLTFEDYLDMLSVFSERAPMSLKAEYAFKIYDFDGDDLISKDDLEELLTRLLGTESYDVPERDIQEVLKTVLKDGDIDEDGNIAFTEFSHVLQRVPDFMKSFVITL
ncbi:calcium and integrin-binding protein 1-like [Stegodyphus dumicola]|uniref:calcium and integrin-binding protein 1-like n=1 Tax=Stegodyphus dumicola TaxID=202533 RepID=UPI0015B2386D|nr:calcium and integrin-binding protein 1-like [Stegodyphus dumicola]